MGLVIYKNVSRSIIVTLLYLKSFLKFSSWTNVCFYWAPKDRLILIFYNPGYFREAHLVNLSELNKSQRTSDVSVQWNRTGTGSWVKYAI